MSGALLRCSTAQLACRLHSQGGSSMPFLQCLSAAWQGFSTAQEGITVPSTAANSEAGPSAAQQADIHKQTVDSPEDKGMARAEISAVHQVKGSQDHTNVWVREAFTHLDVEPALQQLLLAPRRELHVELPIVLDSQEIETFNAYRVQHNNLRGPYKGGWRLNPEVDMEDVRRASAPTSGTMQTSEKLFLCKRTLTCMQPGEPHDLEDGCNEMLRKTMGPYTDIPGPEISSGSQMMAWIFDEYSRRVGYAPACTTGKPLDLQGIPGREYATGRGAVLATRELLSLSHGGTLSGKEIVIQGFGNVGSWAAELFSMRGAKVLAVSDRNGVLYNKNGLDVRAVRRHIKAKPPFGGSLTSAAFAGEVLPLDDLWTIPCDIFVPAAISKCITAKVAEQLDCQIVVEAANAPCTVDGDAVLRERGITVLPDVIASSGGVVCSYLEWQSNIQSQRMEESDVNRRMDRIMQDAFEPVWQQHKLRKVPLRSAAYIVAVGRVVEAAESLGYD